MKRMHWEHEADRDTVFGVPDLLLIRDAEDGVPTGREDSFMGSSS